MKKTVAGAQAGLHRFCRSGAVTLTLASTGWFAGCSVDARTPGTTESPLEGVAGSGTAGSVSESVPDASGAAGATNRPEGSEDSGTEPTVPDRGNGCDAGPTGAGDEACPCVPGEQRDCGIEDGSRGCSRGTQTCERLDGGSQSQFGACLFAAVEDGSACDDEDAQTVADACQGGICRGGALGALATGSSASCAIRSGGAVYCWGSSLITGASGAPPTLIPLPGPAEAVSVGGEHACATLADRSLHCWGSNGLGALGNGSTEPVTGSVAVALPDVVQVAAGASNTAAVTGSGTVFVWGGNIVGLTQPELYGPLGPAAETQFVTSPFQVAELGQVAQLGLGSRHACAVLGSGQAVCWGRNDAAQLGRPALSINDAQATTVLVPLDGDDAVTHAAAGESYSCVLRRGGTVVCWGSIFSSELDPAEAINAPPRSVPGLSGAVQVSVGSSSACALRNDRTVACWGANVFGELGTGSFVGSLTAQTVAGLNDATLLGAASALGGRSMCALRSTGSVVCWGENNLGQLGDGTTTTRPQPVQVIALPD
jgi:alpha-tubulin suppressor-like RCC1 family protein